MKKKLFKPIPQKLEYAKNWCGYCGTATMVKKKEKYLELELWECGKCKLLERYPYEN